MSFILDALKRADQERRQEPLEVDLNLHSEPAPPPRNTARRPWVVGGVTIGAFALAVLLGVQLMNGERPEQVPTNAQPPAREAPPEAQMAPDTPSPQSVPRPTTPPPKNEPAEDAAPERTPEPEVESLYANSEPPEEADTKAVEQLYQQQPRPRPRNPDLDKAEPVAASVTRLPEPAETEVGEPEPERLASPSRESSANPSLEVSAPPIRDLPWAMQQKIPSISYLTHRYNDGGNSSVVLNGRELREGSKLTNALKVEEILSDGVILSFEGHRFKLRAQSSWVNM